METPTFKLEGIVKSKDEMEDFEGPLALILLLLSKNKIEIRDVQISVILEQYLEYLDEMKRMDLEIASEFIAMASHLTYIKAKMLLSSDEEPPSELETLMSSLEELRRRDLYAGIKFAAEYLRACRERGIGYFTKPPEPLDTDRCYSYIHPKEDLEKAILAVLSRGELEAEISPEILTMPQKIPYSVSQKTEEILSALRSRGTVSIRRLLTESQSRTEIIATFVAVLELCKIGSIILVGSDENPVVSATGI